ncbi:MAG TPA: PAS domain-containing protein [Gaiellaceae bacterium]|nr:PAS domain-containing protein [Gaiellaceae bacterium]
MTATDPGGQALAQLALLGEAVSTMSGVAVFVWDDDRTYVAVNDAACELTGYTREQLLTMRVGDSSAERAEPHFTKARLNDVLRGNHEIATADGPLELEWITCRTTIAGLPYFVSVVWPLDTAQ